MAVSCQSTVRLGHGRAKGVSPLTPSRNGGGAPRAAQRKEPKDLVGEIFATGLSSSQFERAPEARLIGAISNMTRRREVEERFILIRLTHLALWRPGLDESFKEAIQTEAVPRTPGYV
jgi:hypothetical protein